MAVPVPEAKPVPKTGKQKKKDYDRLRYLKQKLNKLKPKTSDETAAHVLYLSSELHAMRTRISRLEQAHTKAQLWQTEVCGLSHATCCCAQEVVHCRSCVLRNVCLQAGCVLASLQQAKAVLEKNVNRRQQGRGHTLVSSLGDKAVNQASPLRLTGPKASCESTAPASRESTFSRASCESNFSRGFHALHVSRSFRAKKN